MNSYYQLQYRENMLEDWISLGSLFVHNESGLAAAKVNAQARANQYGCQYRIVLMTREAVGEIIKPKDRGEHP